MLQPCELRNAQDFPERYVIDRTSTGKMLTRTPSAHMRQLGVSAADEPDHRVRVERARGAAARGRMPAHRDVFRPHQGWGKFEACTTLARSWRRMLNSSSASQPRPAGTQRTSRLAFDSPIRERGIPGSQHRCRVHTFGVCMEGTILQKLMAVLTAMRHGVSPSPPSIDGLEVHESSWNEWLESGGQPDTKDLGRGRSQNGWLRKLLRKRG